MPDYISFDVSHNISWLDWQNNLVVIKKYTSDVQSNHYILKEFLRAFPASSLGIVNDVMYRYSSITTARRMDVTSDGISPSCKVEGLQSKSIFNILFDLQCCKACSVRSLHNICKICTSLTCHSTLCRWQSVRRYNTVYTCNKTLSIVWVAEVKQLYSQR